MCIYSTRPYSYAPSCHQEGVLHGAAFRMPRPPVQPHCSQLIMPNKRLIHSALLALSACHLLVATPAAHAGSVLDKITTTKTFTIGYRPDYPPFAYTAPDGRIVGYAIDSCNQIASIMGKNLGIELKLNYIPVSNSERMQAVSSGRIDLECADTTSTSERRKRYGVSYLSPYFITGAGMMAHKRSGVNSIEDLKGKTLAYTASTTSEEISKKWAPAWGVKARPCGPEIAACFKELSEGKIDVWMFDDIALQSSRATSASPEQYTSIGKLLSIEQLAPMYKAGDAELTAQLEAAMRQFMISGEARKTYRRWFQQTIPHKDTNMSLPPTQLLQKYMRRPSSDIGEYVVY